MTGKYTVNLGELESVIADMARFDSDAEGVCAGVDRQIAQLHVSWSGDAANAQKQAHQRWQDGAQQMRSALSDLHRVASTAHSNYDAAVQANVGMWPE